MPAAMAPELTRTIWVPSRCLCARALASATRRPWSMPPSAPVSELEPTLTTSRRAVLMTEWGDTPRTVVTGRGARRAVRSRRSRRASGRQRSARSSPRKRWAVREHDDLRWRHVPDDRPRRRRARDGPGAAGAHRLAAARPDVPRREGRCPAAARRRRGCGRADGHRGQRRGHRAGSRRRHEREPAGPAARSTRPAWPPSPRPCATSRRCPTPSVRSCAARRSPTACRSVRCECRWASSG